MTRLRLDNQAATALIEVLVIVGFLGLAVWFMWFSPAGDAPGAPTPEVTAASIAVGPRRVIESDRPEVFIGGFSRNCNECHRFFESQAETARRLTQHESIVLDHGLNDRCFNCHDRADRNRLALNGIDTIPYSEVAQLCAKCHGPTWRDWQKGMHGRTMGSWDPEAPEFHRLRCSECHDPHAPAYPPYAPLPGPNTLRMGDPHPSGHAPDVEQLDPLRKWRQQLERAAREAERAAELGEGEGVEVPRESRE